MLYFSNLSRQADMLQQLGLAGGKCRTGGKGRNGIRRLPVLVTSSKRAGGDNTAPLEETSYGSANVVAVIANGEISRGYAVVEPDAQNHARSKADIPKTKTPSSHKSGRSRDLHQC